MNLNKYTNEQGDFYQMPGGFGYMTGIPVHGNPAYPVHHGQYPLGMPGSGIQSYGAGPQLTVQTNAANVTEYLSFNPNVASPTVISPASDGERKRARERERECEKKLAEAIEGLRRSLPAQILDRMSLPPPAYRGKYSRAQVCTIAAQILNAISRSSILQDTLLWQLQQYE